MPRCEALGDVRADEAGATGEKDAHVWAGVLDRARRNFLRLSRRHIHEYRARLDDVRERCARCPRDASPIGAARNGAQNTNVDAAGRETDYSFGGNLGELPVF